MSSDVDHRLAQRLLNSDETVLDDILRTYGPKLQSALVHRYGSILREEMDDIISVTLYRVWKTRKSFSCEKGSLENWVRKVAQNTSVNVIKSAYMKSRLIARPMDLGHVQYHAQGDSISQELAEGYSMLVLEALNELPDIQRRIVEADSQSPSGNVSSTILAREMNLAPSTVRRYRCQARQSLREALTN